MRILGIDPGLRTTGFGVVDLHGQHRQYVASGCIRAPEGAPLPERIRAILDGIAEVTRLHQPTEAAVEQVFVNVNPASTLLLGQARGAALSALVLANLPIAEYTALQVKQSVVGNGHAGKEQVQAMVVRLLKLNGTPQADAADGGDGQRHREAPPSIAAVGLELLRLHRGFLAAGPKRVRRAGRPFT